ncbi:MAG: UDP-N-acetylmuramoyl-tripeptide--D-alanyl-D-alanine ligase [Actinobacteria bacterium]|nr:UDP-N-acetylmuramoyl-tripeptide--D-alanyl-D-alanine ligase [Actinomycetota bacterium]
MITLTVREICDACSGELLAGSGGAAVTALATDTRNDLQDSVFVALKGDNFDGGDFVAEAVRKGAAGVIAEKAAARRLAAELTAGDAAGAAGRRQAGEVIVIAVADSGRALGQAAALVAGRSSATVVAITGSSGKTSTKDILHGLLRERLHTVASKASFNNEVGVPLTLLQITARTEVAVLEMGMRAPGEIAELCALAAPGIAVITNIGPAHLEHAGSLENIARGKAEIGQNLPPGGGLVIPYGEPLLEPLVAGLDVNLVTFGFDRRADIHVAGGERVRDGRLCLTLSCLNEEADICFNFTARHQLLNAMAAIGAYRLLGQPLAAAAAAAEKLSLPDMRGEALPMAGGGILLNDCYNANPLSMISSLEYLAGAGTGRRTVAILGDMAELGPESPRYHREVGAAAARLGVEVIIGVGKLAAGYLDGALSAGLRGAGNHPETHHFEDLEAAVSGASPLIHPGDAVLVKASRFMGLERLSRVLTGTPVEDGHAAAGS